MKKQQTKKEILTLRTKNQTIKPKVPKKKSQSYKVTKVTKQQKMEKFFITNLKVFFSSENSTPIIAFFVLLYFLYLYALFLRENSPGYFIKLLKHTMCKPFLKKSRFRDADYFSFVGISFETNKCMKWIDCLYTFLLNGRRELSHFIHLLVPKKYQKLENVPRSGTCHFS